MALNFDFLKNRGLFDAFAGIALEAESLCSSHPEYCAIGCRRALEVALKWLYSVEKSLVKPYDTHLAQLLNEESFRNFLPDASMWVGLDFVRRTGNLAAHGNAKIPASRTKYVVQHLYVFFDFLAALYCKDYVRKPFDSSLLGVVPAGKPTMMLRENPVPDQEFFDAQNAVHREELSELRRSRQGEYIAPKFDGVTEAETRKLYIDVMLEDAGWVRGKNWEDEFPLEIASSPSGKGLADYVLFDDSHVPLAVIEAKKTSVGVESGRLQAREYADALERRFGRRPVIFLSNGLKTLICADRYESERVVSGFYSQGDLEWMLQRLASQRDPENVPVDTKVAGRDYQLSAIKSVCEAFGRKNRRKVLLVMATGSGKTRVSAALTDVLVRANCVRRALFLADRTELVRQAKSAFTQYVPDLTSVNLVDGGEDALTARVVFSTYQTMINKIDEVRTENGGRLFACGHFDLIIIDEAHRSIYNKYKDIFRYFDARIVGLTATPREEVERSTYQEFELEDGVPNFAYDLSQAVSDGFLVPYKTIETSTRFLDEGICYDKLSAEEKEQFEATFGSTDDVENTALNNWVFNKDTIREVLKTLVQSGLRVGYGNTLGKTIIFAKNHRHAEAIFEVWKRDFSEFPYGFCTVIDNHIKHAEKAIDDFKKPGTFPQIAISVDMMDTGIDVPEVLNLVFFKKVRSRSKFWQMIGRGTRLCPGLIDGNDKTHFQIFDFCGNFEFFKVNKNGVPAKPVKTLAEQLFGVKLEICRELQHLSYTENVAANHFRTATIEELWKQVAALDRKGFAVQLNLAYVERFSREEAYATLKETDIADAQEKIAPLLPQVPGDVFAARFDAFIHRWELAAIREDSNSFPKMRRELRCKANALAKLGTIPEIKNQEVIIRKILDDNAWLKNPEFSHLETIRAALRDLMKYISGDPQAFYYTDFEDVLGEKIVSEEPDLLFGDAGNIENYRAKMAQIIRKNADFFAIRKLHTNQALTANDLAQLENLLWSDERLRELYEQTEPEKPLGVFVREVVGLDEATARATFADFLNNTQLSSEQRYFVETLVRYIIKNGLVGDLNILQNTPFTDRGSIVELWGDNVALFGELRSRIEKITASASFAG